MGEGGGGGVKIVSFGGVTKMVVMKSGEGEGGGGQVLNLALITTPLSLKLVLPPFIILDSYYYLIILLCPMCQA